MTYLIIFSYMFFSLFRFKQNKKSMVVEVKSGQPLCPELASSKLRESAPLSSPTDQQFKFADNSGLHITYVQCLSCTTNSCSLICQPKLKGNGTCNGSHEQPDKRKKNVSFSCLTIAGGGSRPSDTITLILYI